MKTAFVLLCAAAVLGRSANAEPVLVTIEALPSERVSFADLNLGSVAGQKALKNRIRGAAERVCDSAAGRAFQSYLITHSCFMSSYTDGLRQMDRVLDRRTRGSAITAAVLTIRGE